MDCGPHAVPAELYRPYEGLRRGLLGFLSGIWGYVEKLFVALQQDNCACFGPACWLARAVTLGRVLKNHRHGSPKDTQRYSSIILCTFTTTSTETTPHDKDNALGSARSGVLINRNQIFNNYFQDIPNHVHFASPSSLVPLWRGGTNSHRTISADTAIPAWPYYTISPQCLG